MSTVTAGREPGAATPARSAAGTRSAATAGTLRLAAVLALLVAWEAAARWWIRSDSYVAPPTRVLTAGVAYLANADALGALWTTTARFLAAFAITAVVGVAAGLVVGRLGWAVPAARDIFSVLYTLPLVPFYPLFVLWFGLGFRSEVAFGAVHGIVPVVLAVMAAASRVDTTLVTAARAMGASRLRATRLVVVPAILPDLVGALRVGAALSLLGVLLAELMVSTDGVGHMISALIANLRGPQLDALILAVCVGAAVVNAAMHLIERRFSRWRD